MKTLPLGVSAVCATPMLSSMPAAPVILVGKVFWSGLSHWIHEQLLSNGLVDSADPTAFVIEDEPEAVVAHIERYYRHNATRLSSRPALPL